MNSKYQNKWRYQTTISVNYTLNNHLEAAVRNRPERPMISVFETIFSAPYGPLAFIAAGLCSHISSSFVWVAWSKKPAWNSRFVTLTHCVWLSNPNLLYAKDCCCGVNSTIIDIIPTIIPRTTVKTIFVFIGRTEESQYISNHRLRPMAIYIKLFLQIIKKKSKPYYFSKILQIHYTHIYYTCKGSDL